MNILILGGTVFLGRHLVKSALSRNHNVTLFNRGQHNPELFPEIEKIRGDRTVSLDPLKGRKFDAVIDTCGYFPRAVRMSAEFLKDSVDHYTFISSISAYKDFSIKGMDENAEIGKIDDESIEEITGESYGPLKVLCENVVADVYKDRALNIRPGLIVGENDPSDRFTYWVKRVSEGGKVFAPDGRNSNVQFIDVKDLADWNIKMTEGKKSGLYNGTGPDYELSFEKFIKACQEVSDKKSEIIWANEKFLADENVSGWTDLPMWIRAEDEGVNNVNVGKAVKDGLTFRPLKETISDTLQFDRTREDHKFRAGLKREREAELIEKWESQNKV
ncbi:MAG: NAD-dependent epimerase/dehydratase family protein [Ignavibacteria bacterium]